jgi:phospho-N-acetylmuramoyl-pentapeptide-transferase
VDAKFITDKPLGLSGANLLLVLGISLGSAAFLIDWLAGRSFTNASLTLPLLLSAVASGALGFWVVPLLRRLKMGQVIREDGPQAHLQKAGTPTMGGIFFIPAAVTIALLLTGFAPSVMAVSALTLAYAAIGWLDDWQILRRKSNKGISPRMKLALQISFGSLFCAWLLWTQPATISTIALPFGLMLPLGWLFAPLAGFVLVAESNATNLTDGLDGLAGGTGAIAFLGLGAIAAPTHPELMTFCALPERWLSGLFAPQPQSGSRIYGRYGFASNGRSPRCCCPAEQHAVWPTAAQRLVSGRDAVSHCPGRLLQGHQRQQRHWQAPFQNGSIAPPLRANGLV